MSHVMNTPYYFSNTFNFDYHRIMGKVCYDVDMDHIVTTGGSMENGAWAEIAYLDNEPEAIAIMDWKYPGESTLKDTYHGFRSQRNMAKKLDVHFFTVITYLDENFPIKSYYVIPCNEKAIRFCKGWKYNPKGQWLSLRGFSQFLHNIRGKYWSPKEEINPENLKFLKIPRLTLGELSNEVKEYDLPKIEFSWLK